VTSSLLVHCKEMIQKYPSLRDEIIDIYRYALDEIDDGESVANECELAYNSVQELIEDYTNAESES